MNKELLKLIESLKLDEEMKKKILDNPPKTREELIRLATQLGIEIDFDAAPVELDDSEIAKISGGVMQSSPEREGY